MSDSVRPHRQQPTRLPRPWDSPGKNTAVGCHFLLQCMKMKSLSRVRIFATRWAAAYQAPPPMGFSRQEYWSGVRLPSPGKTLRPSSNGGAGSHLLTVNGAVRNRCSLVKPLRFRKCWLRNRILVLFLPASIIIPLYQLLP